MNISPVTAARIRNAFTAEAYEALNELCETRIKAAQSQLEAAVDEDETWRIRGELKTLRLFSNLEESVKNLAQTQISH